jgi:DNA-binding IclR family transcriptional regulator
LTLAGIQGGKISGKESVREHERHVAAITAAVQILEAFHQDEQLQLKDIYQRTGLNKSRILRILGTLEWAGLVSFNAEQRSYRLGNRLFRLARVLEPRYRSMVSAVDPALASIVEQTKWKAFFSIVSGFERLVIARRQLPDSPAPIIRSWKAHPLHVGASSRVLLAFSSDPARELILKNLRNTSLKTKPTVLAALEGKLERVRNDGHALEVGEKDRGVFVLAVPVWDSSDNFAGSLAVSAATPVPALDDQIQFMKRMAEAMRPALPGLS